MGNWDTPSAFGQAANSQGQQSLNIRDTDTMQMPPLRPIQQVKVSRDLEDAYNQLNDLSARLRSRDSLNKRQVEEVISDIQDARDLIYRNLK